MSGKGTTAPPPPRTTPFLFTVRCAAFPEDAPATDKPTVRFEKAESDFRSRLAVIMNRALPGCKGVLLDLSDAPLARALSLLDALKPQSTAATNGTGAEK